MLWSFCCIYLLFLCVIFELLVALITNWDCFAFYFSGNLPSVWSQIQGGKIMSGNIWKIFGSILNIGWTLVKVTNDVFGVYGKRGKMNQRTYLVTSLPCIGKKIENDLLVDILLMCCWILMPNINRNVFISTESFYVDQKVLNINAGLERGVDKYTARVSPQLLESSIDWTSQT